MFIFHQHFESWSGSQRWWEKASERLWDICSRLCGPTLCFFTNKGDLSCVSTCINTVVYSYTCMCCDVVKSEGDLSCVSINTVVYSYTCMCCDVVKSEGDLSCVSTRKNSMYIGTRTCKCYSLWIFCLYNIWHTFIRWFSI